MIVYASNKQPIGDGVRITRVSLTGQKLEVLVDPKAMKWSEVILVPDAPPPPPPPAPNTPPVILTTKTNIQV
jgi:hypothetical protein